MSIFIKPYPQWLAPALFALALAGCEGSSSDETFSLGGTVTGPAGNGFELTHKDETITVAGKSFTFKQRLADGDAYNVRLTQDPNQQLCQLANASGRVSGRDVKDIDVRCRGWQHAQSLSSDKTVDLGPLLELDSDGNGLMIWTRAGDYLLQSRTYSAQTHSWSDKQAVGEDERVEDIGMAVAFTPDGNAMLVYGGESDNDSSSVVSRRYLVDSNRWEAAKVIDADTTELKSIDLTLDAQGNAIVVWVDLGEDGNQRLSANHYDAGQAQWLAQPIRLHTSPNGRDLNSPVIVSDPQGNAILVWEQKLEGNLLSQLLTLHYSAQEEGEHGERWSATPLAIVPDLETASMGSPQIGIDAQGNALVIWQHELNLDTPNPEISILASRSSTAQLKWSEVEPIVTDAAFIDSPSLTVDAQGNAIAAWLQRIDAGNTNRSLMASHFTQNSQIWSKPEPLDNKAGDVNRLSLVAAPQGNALVVWSQVDDVDDPFGPVSIYANRFSVASKGWGLPALLEAENISTFKTNIAIDISPSGNAVAVWVRDEGEASLGTNDFR